jgi:hypothetical protein
MNHQALHKANQLLKLALTNQSHKIYNLLNHLEGNPKYKGDVFEYFLAGLYKEMGWITELTGGKNDKGVDILLYHPSQPEQVHAIVQAKNMKKPLLKKDMLNEYMNFFGSAFSQSGTAEQYNCYKLIIISLNGYTTGALNCNIPQEKTKHKVYPYEWNYVKKLIQEYAKINNSPSVLRNRSQSLSSYLSHWFRYQMRTLFLNIQAKAHHFDEFFKTRSESDSAQLSLKLTQNRFFKKTFQKRFFKKAVLFKSFSLIFIIWLFSSAIIPVLLENNHIVITETLTHEMRVRLNITSLSSIAKKECHRLDYPISQCREKLVSQYQEQYGSLKTGLIVYFCGPNNFEKGQCKNYGEKRAEYVLAVK